MKKKLFLFFVVMIMGVLCFSQTITVTSPHSGETWYKGDSHSYTIRWTKTGAMDSQVKITLYHTDRETLETIIVRPTANNGSYSWSIPTSVHAGQYVVRVKTMDNAVYGESAVFTIANAPAASINVTSPSRETWYKGDSHSYTIRWTKTGAMDSQVKITLYHTDGETLETIIVRPTANNGSYSWSIPSSVPNGQYVVRVKTMDNAVYDDSEIFNIASSTLGDYLGHNLRIMRDFEVKDIFFSRSFDGCIGANIKNYYSAYNGPFKYRVLVIPDNQPMRRFNINKDNIRLNANSQLNICLVHRSDLEGVNLCGTSVYIQVDPENEITETDERNNKLIKKIYVTDADLMITRISDFKIKKVYGRPSHRWRVKFKIHAKAGGSGYSSLYNVFVKWELYKGGFQEIEGANGTYGPFKFDRNEEKVISFNKIFGHPSKKHSVHPRLKAGHYTMYITITSRITRCESDKENNRYRVGVRLF